MTVNSKNHFQKIVSAMLAVALLFGTLALTGCGGSNDEQDNCYGEDMPVVNE